MVAGEQPRCTFMVAAIESQPLPSLSYRPESADIPDRRFEELSRIGLVCVPRIDPG